MCIFYTKCIVSILRSLYYLLKSWKCFPNTFFKFYRMLTCNINEKTAELSFSVQNFTQRTDFNPKKIMKSIFICLLNKKGKTLKKYSNGTRSTSLNLKLRYNTAVRLLVLYTSECVNTVRKRQLKNRSEGLKDPENNHGLHQKWSEFRIRHKKFYWQLERITTVMTKKRQIFSGHNGQPDWRVFNTISRGKANNSK